MILARGFCSRAHGAGGVKGDGSVEGSTEGRVGHVGVIEVRLAGDACAVGNGLLPITGTRRKTPVAGQKAGGENRAMPVST